MESIGKVCASENTDKRKLLLQKQRVPEEKTRERKVCFIPTSNKLVNKNKAKVKEAC